MNSVFLISLTITKFMQLLYDSGELDAACAACRKVLLDCGESIPDKLHSEDLSATVNEIGKLLKSVANDHFMEMKDMDTALRPTLRFLSLMVRDSNTTQMFD